MKREFGDSDTTVLKSPTVTTTRRATTHNSLRQHATKHYATVARAPRRGGGSGVRPTTEAGRRCCADRRSVAFAALTANEPDIRRRPADRVALRLLSPGLTALRCPTAAAACDIFVSPIRRCVERQKVTMKDSKRRHAVNVELFSNGSRQFVSSIFAFVLTRNFLLFVRS